MANVEYTMGQMLVEHVMMPKSRKRKRKQSSSSTQQPNRRRRQSSSSQSSSERHGLGVHRTVIAVSHKVTPQLGSSAEEMASVLGSELRPEHKLPKKEIWVRPKPKFLDLLLSVGARGNTFTAKEVLSYLIKYISSRQLYDPLDPKKVFCKSDPLGDVFNVPYFTIKDAKRLLFENMTVLHKPPEVASMQRSHTLPEPIKDCYITFRNNREHTQECAPPTSFSLSQPYILPPPRNTGCLTASVNVTGSLLSGKVLMSTGADEPDCVSKSAADFKPVGITLDTLVETREGGVDEADAGISVTPPASRPCSEDNAPQLGSLSESNQSTALVGSAGRVRRRKKYPKRRLNNRLNGRKSRSRSESSSLTLTSHVSRRSSQRSSKRSSRSAQRSSKSRGSYHGDADGGRSQKDRPWYCILYKAEEEIKSQSSDVWSVQERETAVVTDTSDDLWFMEDDRFSIEYEVASDSSESLSSGSDSSVTDAEIFVEVGSSSDSRFADEDTTDSEIPEEDKWRCSECDQINNPVHGYCSHCWARRTGWLADEDRKNPSERLGDKHTLRRALSAPAGCHQNSLVQASSITRVVTPTGLYPVTTDEAGTSHMSTRQRNVRAYGQLPYLPPAGSGGQDFADGKSRASEDDRCETIPGSSKHVLGQTTMSSPTPIRTLQGIRCEGARLSAVAESTEDVAPGDSEKAGVDECGLLVRSSAGSGSEDFGVGSDGCQPVAGAADTVSRHSTDSISVEEGFESAGSLGRKRKALSVSREDSGVCMKRHMSGRSEGEEAPRSSNDAGLWCSSEISPSPVIDASSRAAREELGKQEPLHKPLSGGSHPEHSHQPTNAPMMPASEGPTQMHEQLCRFCLVRPKTASIIHGRTGHQVCCYKCAKKLRKHGKPCPVCRRPIQHIIKNFFA
ncbi:uncharacterized protein [Diadema setosum]|uniref:uncharacterized protein n=1 Tax=Diadema setosum TaxID=31175 RepID=UPI003B3B98FF